MRNKLSVFTALFLLLFLPDIQSAFAQKVLQDWEKHLKAVPPANQYAARAGVDFNGDVYWCVNTQDSVSLAYTIHLIKYDSLGHQLWVNHYSGAGGLTMTDLKVLPDGSSYVYGNDFGSGNESSQACFLQKHDADGNLLWTINFDPDLFSGEFADQIAISPSTGDIVITAYETAPSYQLFLARYNSDGEAVWQSSIMNCETGDITIDLADNIYLAATNHWGTGEEDIAFAYLKFDGQGNMLNFYKHTGGGYSHALATAGKGKTLALDKEGNAYALAWVETFPNNDTTWTNIMLNKFNSDGTFAWKKRLDLVKKGYPKDVATLLADPESGQAIVIGGWGLWKYNEDGSFANGWHDSRRNYIDACQFDQHKMFPLSSGNKVKDGDSGKVSIFDWSDDYPDLYMKGRGSLQPLNKTAIIEPDAAHNALYVTWSFDDSVSLHRVVLRNEVATGVSEVGSIENGLSIYPNPANENTTISFLDELNSPFTLSIYDVRGVRIVQEKFAHSQSTPLSVENLTPGVYQVMISSNGKLYHDKLLVIR